MDVERAKELLKKMITDWKVGCVSGEPFSDDDVINYLFTLDFTEEELLELGFSEDAIDSANEANISNGYTTFRITIEEDISQAFEIEAESMEAAEEKARNMYKAGKLVLDNANLICTQMMAETMDGSFSTSWNEI